MSTSLKIQYANEIAEAMAEALGENFVKQAAGPALEAYKAALAGVQDENGLKIVWNKFLDSLNQEESTNEALQLQAGKAKELGLPGYASPPPAMSDDVQEADGCDKCKEEPCACMADDVQEADTCALCGQKQPDQDPTPVPAPGPADAAEPMAWDAQTAVAADFAMKHLVNVADALDGKGFESVANLVDEALQKLAAGKNTK